tara:strand:+ start:2670 stop:3674 length:1005 start_codon:yes stop_codon:yes gene_type:complete
MEVPGMPDYTFAIYEFADLRAVSGSPLTTGSTNGASGSFVVRNTAVPVSITVNDNDPNFEDGYVDYTGGARSQTLVSSVVLNGVTYPAGSTIELEFKVSTDSGLTFDYIRINNVNVGIGGVTLPQMGTTYRITGTTDGQNDAWTDLACFVQGTLIETKNGLRAIEDLVAGDRLRTRDNGWQPLRWIGHRNLSRTELQGMPDLAPIRFEAGSIGNSRALSVSPQHRILVEGWRAQLNFGTDSVLVPAKSMVNGTTVRQDTSGQPVTYYHIMFDAHQIVFSNGCPTESFHPGDVGLRGLETAVRAELGYLFPELVGQFGDTAHQVIRVAEARAINW